jgi:DNA-binding transcriptional regulator YdaS (Cro superfamily)
MEVEVKVFVSIMSAPAPRQASWIARITSGRVMESRSLFPLSSFG